MSITVADIMQSDVLTLRVDENIDIAKISMEWVEIRHMPVLDEDNTLVGIVTRSDILAASLSSELRQDVTAGTAMSSPVITVMPHTLASDAAALLCEHKIGGLPVVDDHGALVGIVTTIDFLELSIRLLTSGA